MERCAARSIDTDNAVAIEILVEEGLVGFQRGASSRHNTARAGEKVAVAVERPHLVLAGGRVLPGDIIAAGGLDRPDRGPVAKFADGDGCALILDRGTGASDFNLEDV